MTYNLEKEKLSLLMILTTKCGGNHKRQ